MAVGAMLFREAENKRTDCFLCAHRCRIPNGGYGYCGVRRNNDGNLVTEVYGEVIAAGSDPIEKKPLYHFLPGTQSFSVATVGCNFKCSFCQNRQISQTNKRNGNSPPCRQYSPDQLVKAAVDSGCKSMAYTYTEPTIFFEFAYDMAHFAHDRGLKNVFVTNGYMTSEALKTVEPFLDGANVDLKSFRDDFYREICGARLQPVLDTIRLMRELNIWVEVTTLIIPGLNDGRRELTGIARFLADVDTRIPWHISRYHPDSEFDQAPITPLETIRAAVDIGREAGLKYVYTGNVQGKSVITTCPECNRELVERDMFSVIFNRIKNGRCPDCAVEIEGVFIP